MREPRNRAVVRCRDPSPEGYRAPCHVILDRAYGSSLGQMKKIIVVLIVAAVGAAVAWKILTAEVDADASG